MIAWVAVLSATLVNKELSLSLLSSFLFEDYRGSPYMVPSSQYREREFFIDNLLIRIHFIIVMIRWTGLAPWEFEFPFPGSLTSKYMLPC